MEIVCTDISRIYVEPHSSIRSLVLRGVNFNINSGTKKMLALYGPSGCGKSTLLKILSLQINPTTGVLKINGNNSLKLSNKEKTSFYQQIGYLKQIPQENVFLDLTVKENMKIPLMNRGMKTSEVRRRIENMLQKLDLLNRQEHPTVNLSGGELQRLGIAIALISYPSLVFLDEPFSDQDFYHVKKILNLMKEVQDLYNTTYLMSTHNIYILNHMNAVYTLSKGLLKRTAGFKYQNTIQTDIKAVLKDEELILNPNVFSKGRNLVYIDFSDEIRILEYDGTIRDPSTEICYLNPDGHIEIRQDLLHYFEHSYYYVKVKKARENSVYFVLEESGDNE
ncbi:MAG: ATP-binding cassette domain-containing protein [Candidatus Hodarchaeales archaeon]